MKSTVAIGFTNKYYTLWNIISDIYYSGSAETGYKPYEKVNYIYIQNLSMNLEDAQSKAKKMGAINLNPDESLRGQNKSFQSIRKLYSEIPNDELSFFAFGKYDGQLISTCNDINYIYWYYEKTKNKYAKKTLLSNGYKELGFDLVSSEDYDKAMRMETVNMMLKDNNKVIVEAAFNLKYNDGEFALATFDLYGFKVDFLFNNFKPMYYNGYNYALPIIDGKAKKIKGKKLELSYYTIQQGFGIEYVVDNVKILNI